MDGGAHTNKFLYFAASFVILANRETIAPVGDFIVREFLPRESSQRD
jgi:hypothetical protein